MSADAPTLERFHGLEQADSIELLMHLHRYQLAGAFAAGRRVLDFGCGDGYGAALLARSARDVLALDLDAGEIAAAAQRYQAAGLEFRVGGIDALEGLPPGERDLVTCFEVIEHVGEADQERLVAALARALAPGGVLVMSTPNATVKERQYSRFPDWRNPFHVRELTADEVVALVRRQLPEVRVVAQAMEAVSLLSVGGGAASAVPDGRSWVTIVVAGREPVDVPASVPQICAPRSSPLLEEALWSERQVREGAAALEKELASARASLGAARRETERLARSVSSMRDEAEHLRGELAKSRGEAERMQELATRLQADLDHLSGRLAVRASRAFDRWPRAKGVLTWAARRVAPPRR